MRSFPIQTEVGKPTHFTYYIRPTIRAGDIGFDGVEISTPSGIVSVDSLRIDGVNIDDFTATIKEGDLGFEMVFPRKLEPTDSGALVEVVFNALVLREVGTLFEGKVFNTATPREVRQQINPGNAADEIESDLLSVKTTLAQSLLFSALVSPNPFTPNGDAINDRVGISYALLRITSPVPVSIEVFDLPADSSSGYIPATTPLGSTPTLGTGPTTLTSWSLPGTVSLQDNGEVSVGRRNQEWGCCRCLLML